MNLTELPSVALVTLVLSTPSAYGSAMPGAVTEHNSHVLHHPFILVIEDVAMKDKVADIALVP